MSGRLLLTTDAVGGVWRYSVDLARGLLARGVGCVLAVVGPGVSGAQRDEVQGVPGLELVQTGLPLDWTAGDAGVLERASVKLAGLAGLLGVSGVHLHAPALLGGARWPAPVVVVAHSDVGTWWQGLREGPPPADLAWRIEATRAGLLAADAVIAPSVGHASAVRAVYGQIGISVVRNGADPMHVRAGRAPAGRERAVLTAGRLWDEAKGAALLDRVAAGFDAPVRAAGPLRGPEGGTIALPHLALLGTLDRAGMAQAYACASVFVSAARYEPFGLSVLEAAQAGMRLVLWDMPVFRELWDGVARFVSDEAGMEVALRDALDDRGDAGARERASRYTIEAMVEGTLAVHQGVAAGGLPDPEPSGLRRDRVIVHGP